ncbi:MAG: histidine kinase [Chitinophagaceae bacterium]|nr:histidine kinase [Chitinophagaceae bacterium]MCB9046162.1 histidine kinase [Chitinophagales bacterium]
MPLSAFSIAAGHFIFLHFIYNIDTYTALTDSTISAIYMLLAFWGIAQSVKVYPTRVGVTLYSLFVAVFLGFCTVYLSTITIRWWLDTGDSYYSHFLDSSGPVRYVIYWLLFSWIATFFALNKSITTQEQKFKQQADSSALHKEAELFKLRQQLQPHFLYNSLNSINALTIIEPAKAQEMVGKLSDFLRNSVQREAKEKIPVQDELDYLRNYLAIESVRFGDRLNVTFNQQNDIKGTIAPFLLQPLLENAIKFGLYGNTGSVTIAIDIKAKNGLLIFTISNPYDAQTNNSPKGTGFGLAGVQRRLYLLYARADLLETSKDGQIFTTTLKIPQDNV